MNKKQLLSIGEASKYIGVSIDTLRLWEKKGILLSFRPSKTSKRYYRQSIIDRFLEEGDISTKKDLVELAKEWVYAKPPKSLSKEYYSETSDVFSARLQRLSFELSKNKDLKQVSSLIIAILGEIGNNSFNHNIGNWPDIPGVFFGYNLSQQLCVVADRGQGLLKTLRTVKPNLKNDKEALVVAFTEYISARAPEDRGNGLKFVKSVIEKNPIDLKFYTGSAFLEQKGNSFDYDINTTKQSFHGCLAIISY